MQAEGVDWLIHIDTDELLYPGGTPDFSLQTLLAGIDPTVDHVVFPNYVSHNPAPVGHGAPQ